MESEREKGEKTNLKSRFEDTSNTLNWINQRGSEWLFSHFGASFWSNWDSTIQQQVRKRGAASARRRKTVIDYI